MRWFIAAAVCLALGATFGLLSALPHAWPGLAAHVPLQQMRPLHVTFAVAWIFIAYLGALHHFIPQVVGRPWWSPRLFRIQFWLLAAAGLVAGIGYLTGSVSGREYLDFTPAASVLILAAWALFLVNYVATVRGFPRPWPVQMWMWSTGVIVFPLTFIEGHLHLLPYYGGNVIRDLSVQWKSYGALIGSWNLVVYGIATHLADRVDGVSGRRTISYAFYWLGLFNLILGFAHHTYAVPQSLGLRYVSYATSMTEWVILAHLLWSWSAREAAPGDPADAAARPFVRSGAFWVGVNLCLALLISIPALQIVTHGTHVTIAHAMGSTIGINTMILLAAGFTCLVERRGSAPRGLRGVAVAANIGLALLFAGLLLAGGVKGKGIVREGWSHYTAMAAAAPFLHSFFLGGVILWAALVHLAVSWIRLAVRPRPGAMPAGGASVAIPSIVYGVAVVGLASIPWWVPVRRADPRPELPAGRGRDVFVREACWKCHGPAGPGPDLLRDGGPTSAGWTRVMLTEPRWARGDSVMPSFARLPDEDREALVEYVGVLRDRRPLREVEVDIPARPAPNAARGDALYAQHCASCHGAEGRGDGPAASLLKDEAMPRDFTRARFRRRSTPALPTDEDLFISITAGMPGSGMPPHGHLKPNDRWLLVDKVKSFAWAGASGSAGFNPFDRWPREPVAIPEPPAASRERLERGRALVASADCRRCHGDDYQGLRNEDRGFAWIDEAGRPLPRSADLTRGVFKSGSGAKDLYRSIFVGRGGSPMPEYGSLFGSEEDRWAVVEFVRSLKRD